jgi:hypothetical protein
MARPFLANLHKIQPMFLNALQWNGPVHGFTAAVLCATNIVLTRRCYIEACNFVLLGIFDHVYAEISI